MMAVMARCGCSSDCSCAVRSGDCVRVVGSGSSTSPYLVNIVLAPDEDNILECTESGLRADLPEPAVYTESTDCIDMDGDGTGVDPIRASPRMDPSDLNGLSCGVDGLFAPFAGYRRILGTSLSEEVAEAGDFLLVDSDAADVTIVLPEAFTCPGEIVTIKKISPSNDAILEAFPGDFIDGGTSITLSTQWESATVVSGTVRWYLIGSA